MYNKRTQLRMEILSIVDDIWKHAENYSKARLVKTKAKIMEKLTELENLAKQPIKKRYGF